MALTIEDIRNPKRKSGFDHVNSATAGANAAGRSAGSRPLWRAVVYGKSVLSPTTRAGASKQWSGPSRNTPEEAAQDYCDYINSGNVAPPASPKLKSAGHTGRRTGIERDEEVEAALGVLKDARAQREGKQGYVYCIAEDTKARPAVKVGYSTNPYARLPELQTGNHRKLVLLGVIKGDKTVEATLHAKYEHLNVLGEWFRADPALIAEFKRPEDVLK